MYGNVYKFEDSTNYKKKIVPFISQRIQHFIQKIIAIKGGLLYKRGHCVTQTEDTGATIWHTGMLLCKMNHKTHAQNIDTLSATSMTTVFPEIHILKTYMLKTLKNYST